MRRARSAAPKLLEPIMALEIVTPQEHVGDCVHDLNRRHGVVKQQQIRGSNVVINAEIPLASTFGYIGALRSVSAGRANFSMELSHYQLVLNGHLRSFKS